MSTAVPPELGILLGPLVQDNAVSCPIARFGRLIISEWEAGGRQKSINDVVAAVSESCALQEEEMTLQVDQCKIAKDKLQSELQWVEAKQQAAGLKIKEAKEYKVFCRSVLSGMIDLGGMQNFSAPAPAGTTSRQADMAPPPYHHPDPVPSQGSQHNGTTRSGTLAGAPASPVVGNPDAGLTQEMAQVSNLLQITDVRESTLENALARCEAACFNAANQAWTNREEYEAGVTLLSRLNGHVLSPRPPIQVIEIKMQRTLHKRFLAAGRPQDSTVEFLDTIDTENGAITVSGRLLDSLNDEVKIEALLFLKDLLTDDSTKMVFARSGGLKPLVGVVATSNCEQALDLSLALLWSVCSHSDEIREAVRQLDGLQPVVELLYTDNISILENAVLALGFLTREQGSKTLMRECAGLEKLVASLFHPNDSIVAKAAGVLWNCACDKENRLALKQLGAIPQLLELLKHPSDNVTENACGALWNITAEPDYRKMMAEYNGIPALLKLLSSSKDVVVENASGTLWNCSATLEVRAAVRKNKGLAELLKLLTHPSATVQENAAGVIRNCAINDQNKIALKELGAIELFLDLLRSCNIDIRDKLLSTLWIMTVSPDSKHAVRQASGFPVLMQLLQTMEDVGMLEKVMGILRNCSMERENRPSMCQAGVVGGIAALGKGDKILKMTTALKENAAATIWQLGQDEKVLVRKDGGINLVSVLLRDKEDAVIEQAAGSIYTLTNNEAENRNAVRDSGALERLLVLLNDSARATSSTGSGAKPLNSFALHSVLLAIRNATGSNAINQRLAAEQGAISSLLGLIKSHARTPSAPPAGQAASPDDIVRECLRCVKNVASEKKGADDMVACNGISTVQDVMANRAEDDGVKKAGAMALQSLARLVRF